MKNKTLVEHFFVQERTKRKKFMVTIWSIVILADVFILIAYLEGMNVRRIIQFLTVPLALAASASSFCDASCREPFSLRSLLMPHTALCWAFSTAICSGLASIRVSATGWGCHKHSILFGSVIAVCVPASAVSGRAWIAFPFVGHFVWHHSSLASLFLPLYPGSFVSSPDLFSSL